MAAGAEAPDDEIADELEHSALRARLRSGHAAAATALERAADLTRSDGERGRRLLAAAEAYWLAGRGARAVPLLQRAEPLTRDSRDLRVTAASLRGAYELEYGSPEVAYEVLVSAARTILREEPARALETLLRAGDAAWWSGRLDRAAEIGTLAAAVPPSDREGEAFMVDLLIGVAEVLHGDFARGADALRRALALADTFDHPRYLLPAAHGAVHWATMPPPRGSPSARWPPSGVPERSGSCREPSSSRRDRALAWPARRCGRQRLRGAGAGGRPAAVVAPRPLDSLTPQEQQIARFVNGGATNREVGAKLFLSPRTVQYHLHNIYLKLGIGSRTELAGLLGADGRNPLTVG